MERRALRVPGFLVLAILVAVVTAATWYAVDQADSPGADTRIGFVVGAAALISVLCVTGFTVVNPNEARVIQFFGRYVGSVRMAGFYWVLPFTEKRRVSLEG